MDCSRHHLTPPEKNRKLATGSKCQNFWVLTPPTQNKGLLCDFILKAESDLGSAQPYYLVSIIQIPEYFKSNSIK